MSSFEDGQQLAEKLFNKHGFVPTLNESEFKRGYESFRKSEMCERFGIYAIALRDVSVGHVSTPEEVRQNLLQEPCLDNDTIFDLYNHARKGYTG